MITTLRGLLALAMLAGLYLIPVAAVFAVMFLLTFLTDVLTGNPGLALTSVLGMGTLLYVTFTTGPASGPADDAWVAIPEAVHARWMERVTWLAGRVGTRPPGQLRLTAQANAKVMEETRMLGLIPGRRVMYLGVPLLDKLSEKHLDFVICHELGHYARGHTRVGAICYQADDAVQQQLERLRAMYQHGRGYPGLANFLHLGLITGYVRACRLLSYAGRREQELQADAKAAEITGSQDAVAALDHYHKISACWEAFVAGQARVSDDEPASDDRPYDEFLRALDSSRQSAAATSPPARRGRFDSHPSSEKRKQRILAKAADAQHRPARLPAITGAPDQPLTADQKERLFRDELRSRRDHADNSSHPKLPPAPAGMKARSSRRLRLLTEHPVTAMVTAVVVFSAYGLGVSEGNKHPHHVIGPPGPASMTFPPIDLPSIDSPAFPTIGPSDFPYPQPSDFPPPAVPRAAGPVAVTVTVQPGDTLFTLACRFATTAAAIQRLNHLGTTTAIWAGEALLVPLTGHENRCPS